MRIGQSLWSREDFNLTNPSSSLFFSTTSSRNSWKLPIETDITLNSDVNTETEVLLPHGNPINSSRKLFSNKLVRNRIYEEHQQVLHDGSLKTIYYFRATKIILDDSGPFWPMAFPIKHPTPTFLIERPFHWKEYYYSPRQHFLDSNQQPQTFDNQPAVYKYIEPWKHSIIIYDMDKSPRQQQAKPVENEQMCPTLIFESRFEGGNLRQVKRV